MTTITKTLGVIVVGASFLVPLVSQAQFCTADAMQCPDGSYVGRTLPGCTFVCPPVTSSCSFTANLTIGSRGAAVTCLQNALIRSGYSIPAGATGYFGFQTRAAVAAWQAALGIYPTAGFFGPISRSRWNLGGGTTTFAPAVDFLLPNNGSVGTQVTIYGSGFAATGNRVKFGDLGSESNPSYSLPSPDGRTVTFTVPSSNYLSCWNSLPPCLAPTVTTQLGTHAVSVINAIGMSSNSVTYTVTQNVPVF